MTNELLLITDTADHIFQRSIGAYQVAHHARKHGFTTQVIDFASMFDPEELESLVLQCIDDTTLAIGVSTTFLNFERKKVRPVSITKITENNSGLPEDIFNLLTTIKMKYPSIKIIAGGANSYHIKNNSLIDVVFHGYSEATVIDYLSEIKIGKKRIWPQLNGLTVIDGGTAHFDIENLDHFWHTNDCVLPKETLPIEISRGCIFKCKFCSYPLNGKKKFDYLRDPTRIKDELLKNYESYGTTNYFFTDDTFNDSTHKLEKLHEIITQLPFKIHFTAFLRMDLLYAHPKQILLLYEMGLASAFFGIESLNSATGKIIRKGMNPKLLKKFMIDLYNEHWKKEINFTCSFIIGLPGETLENIQTTYDWVKTAPFSSIWFPFWITKDSHYKSEFDLNFEKYGYTIDDTIKNKLKSRNGAASAYNDIISYWKNEHMTFQIAADLSAKFNDEGYFSLNSGRKLSSWALLAILNYGYTLEEMREKSMADFPIKTIARLKYKLFNQYKIKLLEVISAHK
jgi:radical SAM superfamily enzyme YgiQ (UPF0313 family)